ncbi:transcriptional regulator [Pelagibacterium luteolum]|uniref:Putative antitoxin of toxin-antitoxin system, YdaS/YdaT n=1 Tax=Pelagibacterium luteolum TaxID=440168 RepID=A0A1G7TJ06_9HYPH|nr:YdaS family helix-turn-helix protein [Pelagibacterium luteolum]SDG35191.1 Putative antitoxin of toxin-antitoxin system, YdaS/YdaT [Pelagibacterium luteolum]
MTKLSTLISRAVRYHGSQSKLAAKVGCSQQQIAYLLKAKSITAEMAMRIDAATEGEVSKHQLRPDIFGPAQTESAA